jgi:hypothetical protein
VVLWHRCFLRLTAGVWENKPTHAYKGEWEDLACYISKSSLIPKWTWKGCVLTSCRFWVSVQNALFNGKCSVRCIYKYANRSNKKCSRYTPWRRLGWVEVFCSYSFLTSALNGGEWSASLPCRPLPPGKGPPVPVGQWAGWASEPVWTQRLEEKPSVSVRDRTPVVQSVVRHCTD